MREIRQSGSEGGGTKPIVSPYPYFIRRERVASRLDLNDPRLLSGEFISECRAVLPLSSQYGNPAPSSACFRN
jgi:hypothetical protein